MGFNSEFKGLMASKPGLVRVISKPGLVRVISNFIIIMIIVFCGAFDHIVTAKSTGLKPTKNLLSYLLFEKVLSHQDS